MTCVPYAANNGFTLGIRAPGQTYSQCLAANAGNYSVYNWLPSSAQNGRVARAFDFAGTASIEGAPFLRVLCEGAGTTNA